MRCFIFLVCLGVLVSQSNVFAKVRHRRSLGINTKKVTDPPPIPSGKTPPVGGEGAFDDDGSDGGEAVAPWTAGALDRAMASVADPKCQEKHSIETFVQISSARDPQATPAGHVFFVSDLREVPQLYFLKTPKAWPEQVSFFPDGLRYYRLSPDGEKILLASDVGGDEQYNIYLLDWKLKKLTPLLVDRKVRIESVAWSPKGDYFLYTSNARNGVSFDLYKWDFAQNKGTLLVELTGHNTVTDVSPNGVYALVTQFRSISDSDIWVFKFADSSFVNLTRGSGDLYASSGKFTKDSEHIVFVSDKEGGVRQLALAKLLPAFTIEKWLTTGKYELDGYELDRDRKWLATVTNEDGYGVPKAFEIGRDGAKGKPILMPQVEKSIVSDVSFVSGTKPSLFLARGSSTHTSDIWFWRPTKEVRWTYSTHGLINESCFIQEKLVQYPTFDGRSIPAFLYSPAPAGTQIPFIVYVHGGPEAQYRPMFSRIFQYFLERGFGVFAPNVRGSTGYGKQYAQLDNYKRRIDSVKDAVEGARWLIANRYSRAGQLGIYGGSYGGFMVLRSIEMEPTLFSAAAESVGISDFVTFLKNTKPYRRALREAEYGPLSDEAFLKSISPMTFVDAIKTPLLIFHGANDPRVPVAEAEQIAAELKGRSVPSELKIWPDEGHGNAKLRNQMEQAKLTVYWFEKHLKDDAVSSKRE